MSKWYDVKYKKPELKQEVLIYCQGYDITGKRHWGDYEIAIYDVNYRDKRRRTFYKALEYKVESISDGSTMYNVWQYTGVISWMPLPEEPDKISPEEYARLAGYTYETTQLHKKQV